MTTEEKDRVQQLTVEQPVEENEPAVDQNTEQTPVEEASPATPTLREVIKEQVTEEDAPFTVALTFSKILGGDILNTSTVRRQVWLVLLIGLFVLIYISNRYSCQKNLIEIDRLQKELVDAKYRALSSSSQLTERSRESNVLELLRTNKDSVLHIANQPPFIINVPEE